MADRLLRFGSGMRSNSSIQMKGKYTWVLLFNIDNSTNSAPIQREFEFKSSASASYNEMKKSIREKTLATGFEAHAGGKVFEIVDVSVKGDLRSEVKSGYEALSESKREYRMEFTRKDTFTIGPHSKLGMHVLEFTGPGISYRTDTISTPPLPKVPDVEIDITVKHLSVLKDIEVVYTDDSASRPRNTIGMAKGDNPNINAGFGGLCVWLVPRWTEEVSEAATGISIAYQDEQNLNYDDLAKGAGGLFRYIVMQNDQRMKGKLISEVGLYRTRENWSKDSPRREWEFATENINKDRGKDFLYLVWNTVDGKV